MVKILKLANASRRNRLFFDNLFREIAICIHTGDTEINRDIELPSYRGRGRRLERDVIPISKDEAMGFDTPRSLLSATVLGNIDRLLHKARESGLNRCRDRIRVSTFIIAHSDLTDCHLTALNEMTIYQ